MGADTVKYGVPNASDVVGDEGLILDALNNVLYTFGKSGVASVQQSTVATVLAPAALTNITTAQALLSVPFNAGALNAVGRTLDLSLYGIYSSPGTTTPTLTFTLSLGGVTLCALTTGAVSATASTNLAIRINFLIEVLAAGTNASVEAHGSVSINLTANIAGGAQTVYNDSISAPATGINLTAADNLVLTVSASSNITSVQLRTGYLQLTN